MVALLPLKVNTLGRANIFPSPFEIRALTFAVMPKLYKRPFEPVTEKTGKEEVDAAVPVVFVTEFDDVVHVEGSFRVSDPVSLVDVEVVVDRGVVDDPKSAQLQSIPKSLDALLDSAITCASSSIC